jgi:membrane-associated phospholipid phosphatase
MAELLKRNRYFFIFYLFFLVVGAGILIHFKKGDFELLINQNYATVFTDAFFKYATELGNGWFFVLVIVVCAFIKFRYALLTAISFVLSGLLTQLFKHVLFPHEPRPVAFFNNEYSLHLVPGVNINYQNSFVSGHSASVFACFCMIALMTRNKHQGPLLCFIALTTAFSRVYLLQHFFIDIYMGSLVGVLTSVVVFYLIEKNKTLQAKSWMEKSILTIKKVKNEKNG